MASKGAFHGDAQLKADLLRELVWHREQDMLVRGRYSTDEDKFRGCAVGCAVHSLNKLRGLDIRYGDHAALAGEIGLPRWLIYLMDRLFESVSPERSQAVPVDLIDAIPAGADLAPVLHRFLIWLLVDPSHGVAQYAGKDGQPAIRAVAELHRRVLAGTAVSGGEWRAARETASYCADAFHACRAARYASMDFAGPARVASCAESAALAVALGWARAPSWETREAPGSDAQLEQLLTLLRAA